MEDEDADRVYVPGTSNNPAPPPDRDVEPFWAEEELEAPVHGRPVPHEAPPPVPLHSPAQPPNGAPGMYRPGDRIPVPPPHAVPIPPPAHVQVPAPRPAAAQPPPTQAWPNLEPHAPGQQAPDPNTSGQPAFGPHAVDQPHADPGPAARGGLAPAPVSGSAPVAGSATPTSAAPAPADAPESGVHSSPDSPWSQPPHRPGPPTTETATSGRGAASMPAERPRQGTASVPAPHSERQQPSTDDDGWTTGDEPSNGPVYRPATPPPAQGAAAVPPQPGRHPQSGAPQTGPQSGAPQPGPQSGASQQGPHPHGPQQGPPQQGQIPHGPHPQSGPPQQGPHPHGPQQGPPQQAQIPHGPHPQPGPPQQGAQPHGPQQGPPPHYGQPYPQQPAPPRQMPGPYPPTMDPRAMAHPPAPTPAPPSTDPFQDLPWVSDGTPTAEEFARRRMAKPADPVATQGARAILRKGTMGLVKLAPGKREQEFKQDVEMVRRNFGGLRQVTVVNPKGGAGKTVAVLLLAMTFGQKRGGYVLAWDNNETQGTLGMRAQQDFHARTVRDMMRDLHLFRGSHGRVGDLSQYVRAQGEGMFDVLASDESATAGEMLTADAFGEIREIVSRFYKLIFVDTGNNVRAQNWQAAMDATDQLVITMSARNDSAETAARMLDHLEQSGRQRLVRQAVSVVSMPPTRKDIDLPAIQRHFAARTRAVLLAPYEKLIDSGEPIRYGHLSANTKDAWLKIAAAVAEGL
ncbi:chromosome partitioning protein [Actinoplanes sp. LDG1-01]|uniref:Chromosome partitioning protein n=1 Tax=Paractinoplanes lichenicola TaxID=2802976 RepID=A0ABS1W1T6_9ACTN|nr:ParA family protein [Actinoplanes lichenicola]MBL7260701.1 chromosome partitioning protein [Actinoplanes lichenicola]